MAFLAGLLPLLGSAISTLAPKVLPAIGEGVGRFAKGLSSGKGFSTSLKQGLGLEAEDDAVSEIKRENAERSNMGRSDSKRAEEEAFDIAEKSVVPDLSQVTSINDLNNHRMMAGLDNNVANRKLHSNRIQSGSKSLNKMNSRRARFKKAQKKAKSRRYKRYL